jgi:ABC-type multidrug transport system fused ATPase/permease subunit
MRTLLYVVRDAVRLGIRRIHFVVVVALQILTSIFEMAGLATFVPIMQFLQEKGDVGTLAREHVFWGKLRSISEWSGVPITLSALLLFSFAVVTLRQLLTMVSEFYQINVRERETARVRAEMFEGMMRARADYQDAASSGGIVSDITFNAMRAVQHVFGRFALVTLIAICAVYICGMILIDASLTLLIIGVIAVSGVLVAPLLMKSRRLGKELVGANADASQFIVERLRMLRLIRLSRREDAEAATIRLLSTNQGRVVATGWRVLSYVDTVIESTAFAAALLIIFVATAYFGTPIEIVGLFLAMLLRLLPVVRQIARTKQSVDANYASFESVVRRLEALEQNRERSAGRRSFTDLKSQISLRHVSFHYATRQAAAALENVTATIPAAKLTAIVGPSGSGKSTLVDLLPRIRQPQSGVILFDGVDSAEFELDQLRRSIAFVSQSAILFNLPIVEHIRYGEPGATLEDVREAARLAGADEFIMGLPKQYETLAGEGGGHFSGGQRQRLDLARALLSRAPILILDEPTSALDAASAHRFLVDLDRVRTQAKRTIIIISHNLPSVQKADHIVVLNGGRLEAEGRHDDLMAQRGWYQSTFALQAKQGGIARSA